MLAVLAGLGQVACRNAASAEQCEQALSHLVELEFAEASAKLTTPEQKADFLKQKKQTSDGARAAFMEGCEKKTPRAVVECTLAAKDLAAVAACDGR